MKKTIKIGTRKSKLAVIQAELVARRLVEAEPGISTELVYKTTQGDRILDRPLLSFGGKGVFVTEFEEALLRGEIDIAVHSAKDLPMDLKDGLEIVAIPEREDPRDVLVMRKGGDMGRGRELIIGTSSLRRRVQIENGPCLEECAPVFLCRDLRGNVLTRLNKLEAGEYDGEILAAAGLKRLGLWGDERFDFHALPWESFVPAGAQGILAVEGRCGDSWMKSLGERISHGDTKTSLLFERRVLKGLEAGCHEPVGVYSRIQEGTLKAWGIYQNEELLLREQITGAALEWEDLADRLVQRLSGAAVRKEEER